MSLYLCFLQGCLRCIPKCHTYINGAMRFLLRYRRGKPHSWSPVATAFGNLSKTEYDSRTSMWGPHDSQRAFSASSAH